MTKEQLACYATIAWAGITGPEPKAVATVRPRPGTTIILCRLPEGKINLKAIQETVPFDPGDLRIIANAFSVPASADPASAKRNGLQHVSRRPMTEHVVSWTWTEAT